MDLTRDNVVDYIRKRLGYPVVNVELEEEHYDLAIEDALLLFNRYIGEVEILAYYNRAGSVVLDMETAVRGISNVQCLFPEQERVYAQMNVFELLYRMVYPLLPVGDWYMLRSFYEMYQRVRGTEPDWRWDEWNKKLYVDCHGVPWDIVV